MLLRKTWKFGPKGTNKTSNVVLKKKGSERTREREERQRRGERENRKRRIIVHLTCYFSQHATSEASLNRRIVRAHLYVQVQLGACAWARKHGLRQAKFLDGCINKVRLRWAIAATCACTTATGCIRAAHCQALTVAGTRTGVFAFDTVDKRDVEPDQVFDDAVLELRVRAANELVRLADFEGSACGVERLREL